MGWGKVPLVTLPDFAVAGGCLRYCYVSLPLHLPLVSLFSLRTYVVVVPLCFPPLPHPHPGCSRQRLHAALRGVLGRHQGRLRQLHAPRAGRRARLRAEGRVVHFQRRRSVVGVGRGSRARGLADVACRLWAGCPGCLAAVPCQSPRCGCLPNVLLFVSGVPGVSWARHHFLFLPGVRHGEQHGGGGVQAPAGPAHRHHRQLGHCRWRSQHAARTHARTRTRTPQPTPPSPPQCLSAVPLARLPRALRCCAGAAVCRPSAVRAAKEPSPDSFPRRARGGVVCARPRQPPCTWGSRSWCRAWWTTPSRRSSRRRCRGCSRRWASSGPPTSSTWYAVVVCRTPTPSSSRPLSPLLSHFSCICACVCP
jgi:hypothetical protein